MRTSIRASESDSGRMKQVSAFDERCIKSSSLGQGIDPVNGKDNFAPQ